MSDFDDGGPSEPQSRAASLLAWLGLAPFAVLSLWLYAIADDHPWRQTTIDLLIGYGALVLSFLGGLRWGLAIAGDAAQRPSRVFVIGVLPPLAGWACLWVPVPYCFATLAVAFAAQGAWDAFAVHAGAAPRWFGRTRRWLTVLAVAAMLLAFVATGSAVTPA